jgi:hypothetical protein
MMNAKMINKLIDVWKSNIKRRDDLGGDDLQEFKRVQVGKGVRDNTLKFVIIQIHTNKVL